jgi:hypothetical protein
VEEVAVDWVVVLVVAAVLEHCSFLQRKPYQLVLPIQL